MEGFNLRKFLIENKLTSNSRTLQEGYGKFSIEDVIDTFKNGSDSAELRGKNTEPIIPVMKRYTMQKVEPYLTKVSIDKSPNLRGLNFEQITFNGQTRIQLITDLTPEKKGGDVEASKYKALSAVQELQDVFGNLAERFKVVVAPSNTRIEIYLSKKWEEQAQGRLNLVGEVQKVLESSGAKPDSHPYVSITKGRNGYIVTAKRYELLTGTDFKILEASFINKFGDAFLKVQRPTFEYANARGFTDYKVFFSPEIKDTYK
jgi:hypothetical protein